MKQSDRIKEEIIDLYSEIDLSMLLGKIAEKIKQHLECAEASIFIYNPLKEELSFEIATGGKSKSLKEITLKSGEGIAGWIAQNRQPLIINDCSADPRFATRVDRQVQFSTQSILGVPVNMGDSLLGVLEAINKRKGKFNMGDCDLLGGIAQFVAIPLQNAILFKKILQETREKEQLILLGKKISAALSYNEIFTNLKAIIHEILSPQAIRIFVRPDRKIYDLISGAVTEAEGISSDDTHISPKHLRFPLHTGRGDLGFLEIVSESRIPDVHSSLIRGLAAYLALTIEKFGLYQQMVEKEKVTRELQIAREIQLSFLIPPGLKVEGLDMAYLNLSSSAVGGDYYEILPLPERRIVLSINDVSGHGVPASLLMSIFRANFIYQFKREPDLLKTLSRVSDLIAETTQANHYVTSFTALLDLAQMRMTYVNAGHPSPLLVRDGQIHEFPANSLVIGLMANAQLLTTDFSLAKGDLLLLYTDGVIEAENQSGEQFGSKRLTALLKAKQALAAEAIKEELIAELQRFTGQSLFQDDVTMIIAKIVA